ncbi:DUF4007 family protein [Sphingomonas sp.]|uniref:DUF4007 family protein n=1 Tax=Sphingomonas sp. TaxID=28214 RepID=UPI002600F73F|nr:DUF4007 family protein [Sphingomonas sp.]
MTIPQQRYAYGGHYTFPVRYGWLPKGIDRLVSSGSFSASTEMADALGLGSKMVESLSFWLRAMGLTAEEGDTKARGASEMARLIAQRDAFCELPGTWWFLHLSLVCAPGTVWSWFFNHYSERIFDRNGCIDAFLEHTRSRAIRPATPQVAQKDVACLLAAYTSRPGVDYVDPDDLGACPLRELGLIFRHAHVQRFERTRAPAGVPHEALLACVSSLVEDSGRGAFSLRELATMKDGPGRIFCAGLDALETMVANAVAVSPHAHLDSLAGERMLVVAPRLMTDWLTDLYDRIEAAA